MIYVVMGPTCSGKTELANYIIDKLNCEAINFDAFQIYKDMDIGTAKLSKSDPHYSRYHLFDVVTPDQQFSVMQYQKIARATLSDLLKSNKDVVFVGGTGLYIKATLFDYSFPEEEISTDHDLENLSNEELYSLLYSLDSAACEKIHVNNRKRLIRAISLIRHSKKKKSDIINEQKHELIYQNVRFIFLCPDRSQLYEKINDRVVSMMNFGLVDEVKMLISKYDLSVSSSQGIGYKEVIQYLSGQINYQECLKLIQKRTRNYAKRQYTFFKNQFKYELYDSFENAKRHILEDYKTC